MELEKENLGRPNLGTNFLIKKKMGQKQQGQLSLALKIYF